jgi:hypothetical protein
MASFERADGLRLLEVGGMASDDDERGLGLGMRGVQVL